MIIIRPKCAYIISGEGYIEWNDFTSDTLYTTTTPTKERNIYRSSSISERGLYGARELPIFYLDGKIMARQSIVWGVCAYGGLFPPPRYTYTADLSNCIRDSTETGWRSRMNGLGQKIYKKIHVRMCWTIRWTTESKKAEIIKKEKLQLGR